MNSRFYILPRHRRCIAPGFLYLNPEILRRNGTTLNFGSLCGAPEGSGSWRDGPEMGSLETS